MLHCNECNIMSELKILLRKDSPRISWIGKTSVFAMVVNQPTYNLYILNIVIKFFIKQIATLRKCVASSI